MAEAALESVTATTARALRIVLFGMPASGKSALLGALSQALDSSLVDRTTDQSLGALRKSISEDHSGEKREEVVAYPVVMEPTGAGPFSERVEAVFIDCDGRAAHRILEQQDSEGTKLAQEIRQADALVLTIDASAADEQVDEHFGQFTDFLHLFEQRRGQRSEVAGLPVYLVLTKCDLLAEKNDTIADWEERIGERRQKVEEEFEEFLAKGDSSNLGGFGRIDLHVKATAVRQPPLADRPAKSAEPYGVVELFHECLLSAADYSQRTVRAARRLRATVFTALTLMAIMLIAAVVVYLMRPSNEVAALENSLRTLLPRSASSSERLKEAEKRLDQVEKILRDRNFPYLASKTIEEVRDYHKELEAFIRFNMDFHDQVRDPRLARTEAELDQIAEAMKRFPLPKAYREGWTQTIAGKRIDLYEKDLAALRREIPAAEKAFQKLDKRREDLASVTVKEYPQKRKELIAEAEELPYFLYRTKQIPGSRITWEELLHFDRVLPWYRKWEAFRKAPVIGS